MAIQRELQIRFTDAISRSVRMMALAYDRLCDAAYSNVTSPPVNEQPSSQAQASVSALVLDSWSMVDVADRLCELLETCPGLKRTVRVRLTLKALTPAKHFRNYYQHIATETRTSVETCWPIWGSLSYAYVTPELAVRKAIAMTAILFGSESLAKGVPIVNPVGKTIRLPVDLLTLSLPGRSIDLSALATAVHVFGQRFDEALTSASAEAPDPRGCLRIVTEPGTRGAV